MIDYIYSPRLVIAAKRDYAVEGNLLNAAFMSAVMHDGDAVRKLVHNARMEGPDILRSLYRYYAEHRDKEILWNEINEINEISTNYGGCGIYADTDKNGKKIIRDYGCSLRGGESFWADLSYYDKRHNIYNGNNEQKNVSVAEVLKDTLNFKTYVQTRQPKTPNEKLNLLLQNLFYAKYYGEKEFSEATYYKALQLLNNDLENAFAAKQKLKAKDYMPAIIFLDEKSTQVFDKVDYSRQRIFHKTQLGQEILRFGYLTALGIYEFEQKPMHEFLDEVKSQDLWQVAQSIITQKFAHWRYRKSVAANRLLELNLIKPQPQEKLYKPYYKTDAERAEYMNLYIRTKTAGKE